MNIRVVEGPKCPECGGVEVLLGGSVRPFKVDAGRGGWESNCDQRLGGCGIWFLPNGTVTEREPRSGAAREPRLDSPVGLG